MTATSGAEENDQQREAEGYNNSIYLKVGVPYRLLEQGVFVTGFGFPVVPEGTARIRVQMSAALRREHLERAPRIQEKLSMTKPLPEPTPSTDPGAFWAAYLPGSAGPWSLQRVVQN